MNVRASLKAATQARHDRLDAIFADYDLSDRDQYGRFLVAHSAALIPIEETLTEAGAARLWPEWPAMRRTNALLSDLEALGLTTAAPIALPNFAGTSAIFGGTYVLEGSRLGGKLLARAVGNGLPCAFLTAPAPIRWPDFVAQLERICVPDVDRIRAQAAAAATFDCFLRAAGAPGK